MKEESGKQKLTLSISKEVIDRAKDQGINISQITEKILEAITVDSHEYTQDALVHMYEGFFKVLKPYLKKYGTEVRVGTHASSDLLLNHESLSYTKIERRKLDPGNVFSLPTLGVRNYFNAPNYYNVSVKVTVSIEEVINGLEMPNIILEQFLKSMIDATDRNKQKIKEFEIALRFVKALTDDSGNKNAKK